MKVGLMTCYDLRFPELALAQALQGAEILVLPAAWVRGRSKSITGQRCLPLVRWIPPVIWWRRGSAGTKIWAKPDYRSLWRHHCGSGQNACTHYGGSERPNVCVRCARNCPSKQPSLCAAAIIMMFFLLGA
ncbi:amidase [Escherichia coli]|uniref:Amidase n=1 Tax=Escherichia coli TaxID=562 RepID=A0A3S4KH57_ECOLX|nr:amidase [Escherichia coli]